jgi:peroxiredoxin
MTDPTGSHHLNAGDTIAPHQLQALSGESVPVPDPAHLVHLELRRFAGCPVCNLHLRSVVVRNDELRAAGVREVVVFHSSADDLRKYQAELPFDVIPDPDKKLYAEFGVQAKPRAVLSPRAWPAILRGLGRSIGATIRGKEHAPPVKPGGGSTGLPGDFLIASDGRIVASKYGEHAYDQWPVDEVLALAKAEREAKGATASKAQADAEAPLGSPSRTETT